MDKLVSREINTNKHDVAFGHIDRFRSGAPAPDYLCPDYQIRAYLDMADDAHCWAYWYAGHGKLIAADMELRQVTRCLANAIGWASR